MRELLDAWRRRTFVFFIVLSVFLSEGNNEELVETLERRPYLKATWGGGGTIALAWHTLSGHSFTTALPQLDEKTTTEIVEEF